jgi:predicted nucleic acid-binding protein
MYLVDTSVWIEAQSATNTRPVQHLRQLLGSGTKVGVCAPVVQEFLQGARNITHLQKMCAWMTSQNFYVSSDSFFCSVAAAELYARCRWRGITPRSATDCLIAQLAVEHDLILLHNDRDYEKIAKIEPRLKLA